MEVERCHEDHVATRNPDEYRILEAASEIWVRRVPCHIGILQCGNTTLVMEEYVPGLFVSIKKEVGQKDVSAKGVHIRRRRTFV